MGNLFSSFLLILLISFFFSFTTSKTQNFLQRGSSLSVEDDSDDYITSPDKSFTCGFYEMGENAYWFSIWFTNSKERTVVWMANRNRPVNGRGSRISLQRDGTMMLRDADGSTVWETNTLPLPMLIEQSFWTLETLFSRTHEVKFCGKALVFQLILFCQTKSLPRAQS